MPGPRSQASPGGTCPRTLIINIISKLSNIEDGVEAVWRERDEDKAKDRQDGREDDTTTNNLRGGAQARQQQRVDDNNHTQHQHQQDPGEKAVQSACKDGMPETLSQASPGGTSPRTVKSNMNLTPINPEVAVEHQKLKGKEGREETWVKGAGEEENARYREFLRYMEEKRDEAKQNQLEDEERKKEASKKKESWAMLREAIT